MRKRDLITQAAFARLRKVSRQRVSRLVKDGVIPTHKGKIDPAEAEVAIAARSAPAVTSMSYSSARTRHEQFRAALAELDFKARSGEMIPVEAVKKTAFETGRRIREAVKNITPRIESILAAETDVARVRAILDREHDAVLMDLSDEFNREPQEGAPPCSR
jgi:DNA-binding Lrp family transcriptional regulator